MNAHTPQWFVIALIGMATSISCGDTAPVEVPAAIDATKTAHESSTSNATMTPDLRSAYIAAAQSDAGETYRAKREASGAARFVHATQGINATFDGAEIRLRPEHAGIWEIALSTAGIGCEVNPGLGLSAGAVEINDNRVEVARPELREWYINGPLGIEQGFTLEHAPSCEGTKVVTIDVGGSVLPELEGADGNGRGEAITFVDADGMRLARYTDLYVKDATGKRLDAWMSVTAGRIALHVDDAGATYPVQIDPLIWGQQARLTASNGVTDDYFGYSVALSGDTALVGVPYEPVGANTSQGSAYVFTRSGGVWTQQAKLTASDGGWGDHFGNSVALSGDTALVGAIYDDIGANTEQGAAYVFARSGAMWMQQAKLTASDGAASDAFGNSVALSGDTALVGAGYHDVGANGSQGSVYVFTHSGILWTQQANLTASDGAAGDNFGASVALSGEVALVGATGDYFGGSGNQGSAYVFTRSGAVWMQQAKLTASDGAGGDVFGNSVALSGDTALVGAYQHNSNQGAAYVFNSSGVLWTQQAKLTASDGTGGDAFGKSVALLGDTALVGASSKAVGANVEQGSAYVFTRSGVLWMQQAELTASDGAFFDHFGVSVALSGDTMLVGAPNNGSAYVFVVVPVVKSDGETCEFDVGCTSGFCVDGICCNVACGGGCQACSVAAGAAVNGICVPLAMGTVCRASLDACDAAESCDGATTDCPADMVIAMGTECRATAGVCDVPEFCDGFQKDCPTDVVQVGSPLNPTECRAAVDDCDEAEFCDGVQADCPADAVIEGGTECRAAAGDCDVAEKSCHGVQADCPADAHLPDGTSCNDGAGTCLAGVCSDEDGGWYPTGDPNACLCHAVGTSSGGTSSAALSLLGLAFLVTRRRQRTHRT